MGGNNMEPARPTRNITTRISLEVNSMLEELVRQYEADGAKVSRRTIIEEGIKLIWKKKFKGTK